MRFFPSRHPSRRPPRRLHLEPLENRTTPSGGLLDPTFGTGGTVASSLSNNLDSGTAVAVQPNGQIVVVGGTTARNSRTSRDFLVARYNPNGTLDSSFGSSGGYTATDFKSQNDLATAVALLPSGKILAAGTAYTPRGIAVFGLVRYNANGTLDTTFGSKGKVMTDLGGFVDSMAVQPDGKIILAGETGSGTGSYVLALTRYTATGTLDTTFGSGGKLITAIPVMSNGRGQQVGLQPQPGGAVKIVVAATAGDRQQFVFARFNLNGTTDATFGVNGQVTINPVPAANSNDVVGLAIQPDGKVVVGGYSYDAVTGLINFVAVRVTADGAADAGFGQAMTGVVVVPNPPGIYNANCGGLALQADGRIVMSGTVTTTIDPPFYFAMAAARLNADGTVDTGYGTGGFAAVLVEYSDSTIGNPTVAIGPDGKAVVVGAARRSSSNSIVDVSLARFLPSAPQISSFTASPNPVTAGSNVTLAASVTAGNPGSLGAVAQVAFYADSNNDGVLDPATDALLGYATYDAMSGQWRLTISTAGWSSGSHRLFARAQDGYGAWGDPAALDLQVL